MQSNFSQSQPRGLFLALATFFIPLAFSASWYFARKHADPDFVGMDIGKAVLRSHLPASVLATCLVILAHVRQEKPWIATLILGLAAGGWLAFSFFYVCLTLGL